jgi:hypothetical protein
LSHSTSYFSYLKPSLLLFLIGTALFLCSPLQENPRKGWSIPGLWVLTLHILFPLSSLSFFLSPLSPFFPLALVLGIQPRGFVKVLYRTTPPSPPFCLGLTSQSSSYHCCSIQWLT